VFICVLNKYEALNNELFFTSQKGFIRQAPIVGQVAVGDRAHHVEELLMSETKPGVDVIKLFCL
jgi:hypothetical protein